MKNILLGVFALTLPVSAAAQVEPAPATEPAPAVEAAPVPPPAAEPAPMAVPAANPLPICQAGVTDNCQQGPAAEARATDVYEGGGRDHSATMTGQQAASGVAPAEPAPAHATPASAVEPAPVTTAPATGVGGPLPICQIGITDRCQQGAAAEARAAHVYTGGGRDHSATMTERQATGGRVLVHPEPK